MNDSLEKLEEESQNVLYSCRTLFPFKLFPTYLELTPTRLTIKRMILPFTFHTTPIFIKDVAFVRLSENPFFATLSFEMMAMANDPHSVSFLHPADAKKMEELVIGCMEAMKGEVSSSGSATPRKTLQKIGENKEI